MLCRFIKKFISVIRTDNPQQLIQVKTTDNKKNVFPVAPDNFEDLVSSGCIFVDKTLLIKELLDLKSKTYLITRPRRWGKTLNLNMLGTFFESDVNKKTGKPNFKKQSQKCLFQNLGIANAKALQCPMTGKQTEKNLIEFQGNFPVINLTLKFWHEMNTKEDLIKNFIKSFKLEFIKHDYILKSNMKNILNNECKLMSKYLYQDHNEITRSDVAESLELLIIALAKHYNRKLCF